jgi:hypothetical protein
MPASRASNLPKGQVAKLSKPEAAKLEREKHRQAQAAYAKEVEPHLALLNRLKAQLPAGSADIEAIDALYVLVEMTLAEDATKARIVATWKRDSLPGVVLKLKALAAA